ncbi:hypothetical protein O6H91_01G143300 [Diphasiastrum complanatum]|uniref:Uncharacterized protein n=1 Tax=Diphasiastrum complanatum TaxID=34168 RepID=A0ACC2EX28_DIPCM|nr:hypothetical protein O6H91_01G143300 [Diphasiastrum complanatum]
MAFELSSFIPKESIFFKSLALFVATYILAYFVLFSKWTYKKRFEAASCFLSIVHAPAATILATYDLVTTAWELDAANTTFQNRVMEFSLAYFLGDLVHFLFAAPDDYLFILHHAATSTYIMSCRYYTLHGAKSVMALLAAGEVTSPIQNVWALCRMARDSSPIARQIYIFLSPIFTVVFTFFRLLVGPFIIYKISEFYIQGTATTVIPGWLSFCWMLKSSIAIFGSFVWVYKLWKGLVRLYIGKVSTKKVV